MNRYIAAGIGLFLLVGTLLFEHQRAERYKAERDLIATKFAEYMAQQEVERLRRDEREAKRREEADRAWSKNLEVILTDPYAYSRCVAAGRCRAVPVRVCSDQPQTQRSPNSSTAKTVPPAGEPHGSGASAVPAAGVAAAEGGEDPNPGLTGDCKIVQGMLNALQADIENQEGY